MSGQPTRRATHPGKTKKGTSMNDSRTGIEMPGPSRRDVFKAAGAMALVSTLGGERTNAADEQEPRNNIADNAIIDTHIHVVPTRLPGAKPKPKELDQLYGGPPEAMARVLRREMEDARIAFAFGMGAVDGPDDDPLGVGYTLKLAELVPGLRAIGVADPRRTSRSHLQAVERQLDRERGKIVGLKASSRTRTSTPTFPGSTSAMLRRSRRSSKHQLSPKPRRAC